MTDKQLHRNYVEVGNRLVHYVRIGQGPVLVMQHASPGSWTTLRRLMLKLAKSFTVVAIDTPGHGSSDPLTLVQPEIADYGAALIETITALSLDRVHLYGTHTGAKIALSAAVARPDLIASLFLDGIGVSTSPERADQLRNYTPWIAPRADGSHLVSVWHQVRNMFLFWPWYNETAGAQLGTSALADNDLHELAIGLLLAGERYALAYRAAFRCDPLPMLLSLSTPTQILASRQDPLHGHLSRLGQLPQGVTVDSLPTEADPLVALSTEVTQFALANSTAVSDRVLSSSLVSAKRNYVTTDLGQIHVCRSGLERTTTLMIPPAPASAHSLLTHPLLLQGSALAIDLPGSGRSPLNADVSIDLDTLARAVLAVFDEYDLDRPQVYACGASAVFAAHLARRSPSRIASLLLARSGTAIPLYDLPDLTPVSDGSHLLIAWHFLRDRAINSLALSGRWPGTNGTTPDYALLQSRVLDLAVAWPTCFETYGKYVSASMSSDFAADFLIPVHSAQGVWDPFSRENLDDYVDREGISA